MYAPQHVCSLLLLLKLVLFFYVGSRNRTSGSGHMVHAVTLSHLVNPFMYFEVIFVYALR